MKALNAAGLSRIPVIREKRTEPRKILCLPANSPLKISNSASSLRTFHGGIVFLSSVVSSGLAKALTYEEALQQSTSTPASDFDASGVLDNAINFAVENPVAIAGGAVVLAVPLVLPRIFKKPKPWGIESAKKAYAVLADDGNAQLLDIRSAVELRQVGSPDLRGFKKKPVSIAYKGEDKPGFLKKLYLKFKVPENTTFFILDKSDGSSELVAELVTLNGFKAAYAIKDGAEGPQGWMNSGLPWMQPSKTFRFDLGSLIDSITGALGAGSDALPLALGIAAAAGLGVLVFTKIESILQVIGFAALVQFVSTKFLFAEDRKQTVQQVDEFINTRIAPEELVDEIKQIGKALLPAPVTKSLPAPVEASSGAADGAVQKTEDAVDPASPRNSVKAESVSTFSRPLSPYPAYPDLKPPTSPSPSQP